MFQDHSENGANGKLLRRFYEPLILLSVIDPTRGANQLDMSSDHDLQGQRKLWRDFLDQLSFLCDAKKGGDTVTAIAVQRTFEHPIMWLASNSSTRNSTIRVKAKIHVEWILSQLEGLNEAGTATVDFIENEIILRCIQFSSSRVDTYISFLLKNIKKAQQSEMARSSEDEQILVALNPFEGYRHDRYALCNYAHKFRRMAEARMLKRRHDKHGGRSMWSDIYHNIGRLGCWIKAVRKLVETAQTLPQQLGGMKVELVPPHGIVDIPPGRKDRFTTLELKKLVNRMVPSHKNAHVEMLVESLNAINTILPLTEHFQQVYSSFQPRPHAELLVLEHFFQCGFEFMGNDKYIGCSKPSCYCCDLYMKVHPGRPELRACHGNLWPNWAPPISLPLTIASAHVGAQPQRPQEHATFKMLQEMLPYIRCDVLEQIESRRPRRSRVPDSTTGMSSVVLNSDTVKEIYLRMNEIGGNVDHQRTSLIAGLNNSDEGANNRLHDAPHADNSADSLTLTSSRSDTHDLEQEVDHKVHSSVTVQESSDEDEDGGVLLFSGRRCHHLVGC